jgi:hypothetical protein
MRLSLHDLIPKIRESKKNGTFYGGLTGIVLTLNPPKDLMAA